MEKEIRFKDNRGWNLESESKKSSTKTRKARGRIKRASFGSTHRAKIILRNTIGKMTHEIGLTYPREFSTNGKEVKEHLHKMTQWFRDNEIEFFWFLEFQKRGAPHFHGIISKEVEDVVLKKEWYKIVGSNDPRHFIHGAHIEPIRSTAGYAHYLTSYLTKEEQKLVPQEFQDVGRFWGYSRSLLDPYIIKIILATKSELQAFRSKHIRPLRRWMDNKRKNWKFKKKPQKYINIYSSYSPGDYVTIRDGRKYINELERRGLDTSLFE
jgi:hypothetical protein